MRPTAVPAERLGNEMTKVSSGALIRLFGAGMLVALLGAACSGDDGSNPSNPGGTGGRGGSSGTGATGGTAGRGGTGGTTATGGTGATGGSTGTSGGPNDGGPDADTGPNDAEPDGSDGGCPTGQVLRYETAGCNAQPRCGSPAQDACLGYACSCQGTLLTGCDYFTEPYVARGTMCNDGSWFDTGSSVDTGSSADTGSADTGGG
jgi:hypothetical protein